METTLAGRVALVTGAGRGIGASIAVRLAERGTHVGLFARSSNEIDAVARRIRMSGGTAEPLVGDVRDPDAVAAAIARIRGLWGPVEILVNNAGYGVFAPIDRIEIEAWRQVIDTNLTGAFIATKTVLADMKIARRGWIISIGSRFSRGAAVEHGVYSASKYGLLGLMQCLAAEAHAYGIKVATVCPGDVNTTFGQEPSSQTPLPESVQMLEPADVAGAVLFLLDQPSRAWTEELNLWPFPSAR